jgi:hypothetical protein
MLSREDGVNRPGQNGVFGGWCRGSFYSGFLLFLCLAMGSAVFFSFVFLLMYFCL